MRKEIVLTRLRAEATRIHPDVLLGWDLGLSPLGPEDADLILEIFMLPKDKEMDFLSSFYGRLRKAEKELGLAITGVFHDPAASEEFYCDTVEVLKREYRVSADESWLDNALLSLWRSEMKRLWVQDLPRPLHA